MINSQVYSQPFSATHSPQKFSVGLGQNSVGQAHQSADQLLLPKKVASILCVSRHTLSIWRSTGRYPLPYCKIGSRVLYRQSDVFAFIESRMEGK